MELSTHLNISSIKHPVTSRVNPPCVKCIHMVEKFAYSRGVIHSLTNNANMVDLPSLLKEELRSLTRCYSEAVVHNKNI